MGQNPSATKEDVVEDSGKNSGEVENKTIAKLGTADLYAKVSSDKTRQRISWTKVKGADGYSVYFTPCSDNETVGNFDLVKNVNNKTFSFIKKGLKKGKAYKSYDTNIAIVSSKGVIKGKSKGTCKVHVIANNGVEAIIKVTIK